MSQESEHIKRRRHAAALERLDRLRADVDALEPAARTAAATVQLRRELQQIDSLRNAITAERGLDPEAKLRGVLRLSDARARLARCALALG